MRVMGAAALLLLLLTVSAKPALAQRRGTVEVRATVVDLRVSEAGLQAARRLAALAGGDTSRPGTSFRREIPHGSATLRPLPCGGEDCDPAAVVTIVYW
jgi:hypothetical protein